MAARQAKAAARLRLKVSDQAGSAHYEAHRHIGCPIALQTREACCGASGLHNYVDSMFTAASQRGLARLEPRHNWMRLELTGASGSPTCCCACTTTAATLLVPVRLVPPCPVIKPWRVTPAGITTHPVLAPPCPCVVEGRHRGAVQGLARGSAALTPAPPSRCAARRAAPAPGPAPPRSWAAPGAAAQAAPAARGTASATPRSCSGPAPPVAAVDRGV